MAKVYQANEIKNVAMLGGSGSGKTTLMESMLFESGVIKRRGSIESQSTVCDYFPVEKEYGYSVFSTVCNIEFEGKKLNVIDCAGSDDFCGGTMAALQMCGSALIVLSANGGVEVGTQNNFRLVEKVKKPLAFVINKCDHQDADFDRTFNQLKENFGNKCTLIQFPVNAGNGFNAVIDVLKGKMLVWKAEGGAPEFKEIPAEYADRVEEMRQQLQEQAAEADETLLDKFLSEGLTDEEIMQGLKSVYADGSMYPVICTSGLKDMGVRRLMDFLNGMAPSPAQFSYPTVDGNRVSPDASAPTSLYVFKTSVEPHIGEVSYFRVMQGTVRNGDDMQNMERGSKERISQLYMVAGANRIPVDEVAAGDIAATVKLKDTRTGNTLNAKVFPTKGMYEALVAQFVIGKEVYQGLTNVYDNRLNQSWLQVSYTRRDHFGINDYFSLGTYLQLFYSTRRLSKTYQATMMQALQKRATTRKHFLQTKTTALPSHKLLSPTTTPPTSTRPLTTLQQSPKTLVVTPWFHKMVAQRLAR